MYFVCDYWFFKREMAPLLHLLTSFVLFPLLVHLVMIPRQDLLAERRLILAAVNARIIVCGSSTMQHGHNDGSGITR